MADEVRRSGRANKGHHTKNQDALDEPLPKPKPKSKTEKKTTQGARSESAQSGGQQEEEDAIIRCVCGDQRDIRGRQMICCDKCEAWQHNRCLGLQEGDYWDDKTYFCEQCKPEDHVDLLAAMARGEKPWNRKKGSKHGKSKPRPSDVKSEAEPDKPKIPTPQPAPVAAPTASPAPTPAPAPVAPVAPVPPATTPQETPPATSNGHAEPKSKKGTPKSQPQSPLGEKRGQDVVAEKETPPKKRRKSSTHQAVSQSVSHPAMAADPAALPEKQRFLVTKLVETLASMIKTASESGGYRIPDGATPSSIATRLALQIDHAAVVHLGEPTDNASPYVVQLRSIIFNAKKNNTLVDRLLSGSLSAEELASMAREEMASEEKQREYAAMREANEKQMVLTEVPGPRLRKTHKGEELVGEDNEPAVDHEFRPPERRDRESIHEEKVGEPQSPNRDDQTVVELPEDIDQRAPLTVDTSNAQPDSVRRPSTTFDINSVFDKVRSPQHDQKAFIQRRQSSMRVPETPQEGPGDDAEIDRLLKDEDNDVEMTSYTADPTIVWQGKVAMQSMGPFDAVGRFVAGGDFGQVVPWDQLLSSTLPIQGRIESHKGNEYIQGLAETGSHDVGVLSINPVTSEGRNVMDHLYNYFHPRDRWGVVPVDKLGNDTMRDLYVIPIEPGGSNLPPFLDMLEYCTIETPRKEHMILLALIAKLPDVRPQLGPTQHFDRYPAGEIAADQVAHPTPPINGPTNGPSPSPVPNPQGPQFSPLVTAFPPAQSYGNPYASPQLNNGHPPQIPLPNVPPHHRIPKALEIFGPYIDMPVVVQMLNNNPAIVTEDLMLNLKSIVETVPEARTDLNVLSQHIRQRNEQKSV